MPCLVSSLPECNHHHGLSPDGVVRVDTEHPVVHLCCRRSGLPPELGAHVLCWQRA